MLSLISPCRYSWALEGATSLRLEDTEQAAHAAICLGFGLLIGSERACARLGGERVHSVGIGRSETERQNALRCCRG